MPKRFFTADPHFSHGRMVMAGWRPFSSIEAWNTYFLDVINTRVNRNDTLWILGDFSFGIKHPSYYRQQIKCKDVRFIYGNHDNRQRCKNTFKYYYDLKMVNIKGVPCFLAHYPTLYWNKSHHGSFHLSGHVHSQRTKTIAELFPEMRALDVSPDNYNLMFGGWDIFSEDLIYETLSKRAGHDPISFYQNYQVEQGWSEREIIV